jgi:hypothetical protein
MLETKGNTTRHLKVDWVASQLAGWASQCGAGALARVVEGKGVCSSQSGGHRVLGDAR